MAWNHQFLRRKLLTLLKKRALVEQLLITNYVTGYFLAKDIGVNLFQLFIVLTVVLYRYLKISYHYYYLMLNLMSQQVQVNHHLQQLMNG